MVTPRSLAILGTRGVPARHGGFETFAEQLSLYLVTRGWDVSVYCQELGGGRMRQEPWRGIRRVVVPVPASGAGGTVWFDALSTAHAATRPGVALVLGYNTAVLDVLLRLARRPTVMNMDGIEWQRQKWSPAARAWLRLNEWAGAAVSHHLIADHPEIRRHLERDGRTRSITTIPYGADRVEDADPALLEGVGVRPGRYALMVGRPEPENLVLEVVHAYSARPRGYRLVVLGAFDVQRSAYHRAVVDAAGPEVTFPGAIYDGPTVQALRYHARLYIHGHTVGGTNPSLVEALGAGNAVLAHDNRFNRWVAGGSNAYFADEASCRARLDALLDDYGALGSMAASSLLRHREAFEWGAVLRQYEAVLERARSGTTAGRAEAGGG